MIKVLIKSGGDLASGVALSLHRAGFQVLITEIEKPTFIRSNVSFGNCIFEETMVVEGVTSRLCTKDNYKEAHLRGEIPVVIDEMCAIKDDFKPLILVDGILGKKNLGTTIEDAPIVIALGPGFVGGVDCHLAIETKRGHNLGRHILSGSPIANTGVPGIIGGYGVERVIKAPVPGVITKSREIGEVVEEGDWVMEVSDVPVTAPFKGLVRGSLRVGFPVTLNMKIGDIDPRLDCEYNTVSDKARTLGRSVLEGVLFMGRQKGLLEVKIEL